MEYYLNSDGLSLLYIIFHGLCHFEKADREVLVGFQIDRMADDKYVATTPALVGFSVAPTSA